MAADQRKKRLNAVYPSHERHKVKRKKLVLSSIRSNISLEWDDKRKSVVPKREQIGIARRELSAFTGSVPSCYGALADIVTVPRETFELQDLAEVLSCEVWKNNLSEKERNFLAQFLPKGVDAHKVVQELLAGNNFHFGNPFLKWGSSLCSGSLHPDFVLEKERILKANKKEYYSRLHKYHHDMIGNLQMLKGRWAKCKDPEKEIGQKLWRLRNHVEKNMATCANESRHPDAEDCGIGTSGSYSSVAEDKACSSDDMIFTSIHEDSRRRKVVTEGKYGNSSDRFVARPRKGAKLLKDNLQCGDGAKYMSYIKVSKEQHQRVKSSLKHSSSSVHCRSLNQVLGDLDTFCVRPYKVFEEEEQQKLHEYWLRLANRDIVAGFANWKGRQIEKRQAVQALGKELVVKLSYLKEDEEKESPNMLLGDQVNDIAKNLESTILVEDEDKVIPDSLLLEQMDNAVINNLSPVKLEGGEDENRSSLFQQEIDYEAENDESVMEDETDCPPTTSQNQHMQQSMLLGGEQLLHSVDLDSHEICAMPKLNDFPPSVSKYSDNLSQVNVPFSDENLLSDVGSVWPGVSVPSAYYHPTPANHEYVTDSQFSHQHPRVLAEHPPSLMALQPDMQQLAPGKDLSCRQTTDNLFSAYSNQVQNEHYQSFFKGQGSSTYYHEQKGTNFQPPVSAMIDNGQFVGHLQEQLHPSTALDLRQSMPTDIFMHQNIEENIYTNGVGYSMPRQESSTLKMQEWTANAAQLSGPSRSHLNAGGLMSQNWFSAENQVRGRLPGSGGVVFPSQNVGNGSIADQSLFSVLSQCNNLPTGSPFDSMGASERFSQVGNYNGVGGVVPVTSSLLLRSVNPLNYLSGHEATDSLKTNNMGWMSVPRQSTALHDSMGKPMRYWNH